MSKTNNSSLLLLSCEILNSLQYTVWEGGGYSSDLRVGGLSTSSSCQQASLSKILGPVQMKCNLLWTKGFVK